MTCASTAFQCYDQRCIPKSRVCDSYFDCYGKFHEDEDRNCSVNVHESCVEWFSENMGKDGVYHIHLGQPGTTVLLNFVLKSLFNISRLTCIVKNLKTQK